MQYIQGTSGYVKEDSVVTLGKFDGLHRGHHKLIERVCDYALEHRLKSVVFAFDMTPWQQEHGVVRKKILMNEERAHLLADKVDYFIECPFTQEIHDMKAEDFIETILLGQLHAKHIVVGDDFRFGYDRQGSAQMLKQYEEMGRLTVEVVTKEQYQGREISSTYIRELLPSGEMELVTELLGYPYTVLGKVVYGNQIGRTLGIPTMNLLPDEQKLLPPFGVYFCRVQVDQNWYDGICNIGVKPTVGEDNQVTLECHLFGYHEEAYGKEIEVQIYHRQRGELKFANLAALQKQMEKDMIQGQKYFAHIR